MQSKLMRREQTSSGSRGDGLFTARSGTEKFPHPLGDVFQVLCWTCCPPGRAGSNKVFGDFREQVIQMF